MKNKDIQQNLSKYTKPDHPVFLISGSSTDGMNVMIAGWVMRTSLEPPLVAVSVGFSRYTHELMERSGEFVLSYPSESMIDAINLCGTKSGRDMDKIKETGLKTLPAEKTSLVLLEDARLNLECRITDSFTTGDHTVFVGEVLHSTGDPGKLPLLNVGNYRYRTIDIEQI